MVPTEGGEPYPPRETYAAAASYDNLHRPYRWFGSSTIGFLHSRNVHSDRGALPLQITEEWPSDCEAGFNARAAYCGQLIGFFPARRSVILRSARSLMDGELQPLKAVAFLPLRPPPAARCKSSLGVVLCVKENLALSCTSCRHILGFQPTRQVHALL